MSYWEPRTEHERNHFARIRTFVEGIDLDTSFEDVSKIITSEMNRWQQKNGFWYSEENRPKPTPASQPGDWAGPIGAQVLAIVVFTITIFAAGFGWAFLAYIATVMVSIFWPNRKRPSKAENRFSTAGDGMPKIQGKIRTDLNASQKRALEAEARRVIRETGVVHFKLRIEERDKKEISSRRRVAKQSGLFDPELKPQKQQFGVSDEGAEALVAQWMRWLGVFDAEVTKFVGDGGIDVESSRYIAQVKNFRGNVGIAAIRELAGVASVDGRTPLFFTSGDYPKDALIWAQNAGIYLFTYDAKNAKLSANNQLARDALGSGLPVFDD